MPVGGKIWGKRGNGRQGSDGFYRTQFCEEYSEIESEVDYSENMRQIGPEPNEKNERKAAKCGFGKRAVKKLRAMCRMMGNVLKAVGEAHGARGQISYGEEDLVYAGQDSHEVMEGISAWLQGAGGNSSPECCIQP